ncbi:MAG: SRPBCC domain-containing protein [Paracoccaceae bacterium]
MTDPIRKTVSVPLPPDEAFRVFTADMSLWWPVETHSLSASSGERPKSVHVDAHEGGHITEVKADGARANWATITKWQPGEKFEFDWYVGRDPSEATCVSVTFLADGADTIVTLIHDGFDRLGAQGAQMAANYNTGWDGVLGERFGGYCRKAAA